MMAVQEAAHALNAGWSGEDAVFTGVSTDSRTVQPGDLFVALSGKNFDGHAFIASAVEKGAVAAMVSRNFGQENRVAKIPFIQVNDAKSGLGKLAAHWRKRFTMPLVAVTGSNGKTTVKEMIASILRQSIESRVNDQDSTEQVLATEGNLNNEIGVPQMLLRLRAQHIYAVIEMGMNHVGEIAYLSQMAKPNVAVITNAAAAHIEGLGSVEAVAQAKGEIFEGLDQEGIAIINADDGYASLWRKFALGRHVVDFGFTSSAQVNASYQIKCLKSMVTLQLPDGIERVELQVPGEHNVRNALAAAAVAVGLGISRNSIALGLEKFSGVKGRLQKKNGINNSILLDDSYNANPASVQAALTVLTAIVGRKFLVLGDMGELGESAADFHRCMGKEARLAGLDGLLTLGELSAYASAEFGSGGRHFECMEELLIEIEKLLAPDVTLLVKGSRAMKMERVVKQFEV
ncbi:MAG: UDP-N-acetylmuramoyl-tripeptide--D-alanyl-D-alanine ligase [Nitrosomonas sp.]|nr:UDP-N-acetylmuramoyl-tripeptide--D-alanyl-D-alanine ligase [Nitrosomonas sp.]MDP1949634.1 UDP-N-acetylmuramoyl-tripeptide--D-alanyl-D-alanine ligase [Nitrosomonas sp.]